MGAGCVDKRTIVSVFKNDRCVDISLCSSNTTYLNVMSSDGFYYDPKTQLCVPKKLPQ